jgi:eukaryotic-like serine/threonine-protein kinase
MLGRYRLLERLGAGGFGVVWRAHDELLQREVALKRVSLDPGQDSERAEREAQAAARLCHPAIVALYEACAVDDAFFLISELVRGPTLARLIAEDRLDDDQALQIGLALCEALAHAHERGVIHRDLKPQNVLVPDEPGAASETAVAAKLTDFGGASLVGEEALTRTGDVLGTLAYMAPEQSDGLDVDEQADLYSLALVTYEALCGVNPVRAATPAATVRRIGQRVQPLARRRPDLPRDLTDAVDLALAAHPDDRGSVCELGAAFELALGQEPTRPRWPGARPRRLTRARVEDAAGPPRRALAERAPLPAERPALVPDAHPAVLDDDLAVSGPALPRVLWLAGACLLVAWQAAVGRSGVALVLAAALAPLLVLPGRGRSSRLGLGWCSAALAPALGVLGLAAAYPAIAGQASRWVERVALGALGYWWLVLAEPLLDTGSIGRLWLGARGAPARSVWEGSLTQTAAHVISPLLVIGVLLGAALWGLGAALLPWIVRGRSAALDVVAVTVWSAVLASAAPMVDSGIDGGAAHPTPRGVALGALLGGAIAVAARALRGPV